MAVTVTMHKNASTAVIHAPIMIPRTDLAELHELQAILCTKHCAWQGAMEAVQQNCFDALHSFRGQRSQAHFAASGGVTD